MPKIVVKTADLPREKWLKYRKTGIGGSDAATVCGLNPYSSAIELWADKTGRLPDKEDTEAMRVGRDLEQYVAERFCEATGKKVRRRNAVFRHDEHDFIIADIDREVVGENAGLECKTTSMFNTSDFESGEIPQYYYVQCMHYMNVMGYDKMYLAVLVLGKAFFWFEIPYSKSEGDELIRLEKEFWENHVVGDERPAPDGSDSAKETLDVVFKERRDNTVTLFEQEKTAANLSKINAQISALEADKKLLTQTLINALESNTDGITENYTVSYKPYTQTKLDTKALKANYPDIYGKFTKLTECRRFTIKEKKE